MSKIGKGGTVLSIFSGFILIAWAIIFIFWGFTSRNISGFENAFCFIAAVPIFAFGIILIIGGHRQLKGIREGKEYHGPSGGIK